MLRYVTKMDTRTDFNATNFDISVKEFVQVPHVPAILRAKKIEMLFPSSPTMGIHYDETFLKG